MFIPSLYKTTPQQVVVGAHATAAITAVTNVNYTKLSLLGFESSNQTGALNNGSEIARLTLNSTVQIENVGGSLVNVQVEEFIPGFFRQAFVYQTLTIAANALTGTYASGLTLGSKAYVHWLGCSDTFVYSGTLALAQLSAKLSLNVGTGVVTGTRFEKLTDSDPLATGLLTVGFIIIDPR